MSSSESDEFEVIDQLEASLSPEELAQVHVWLQPTDYEAQSSEFRRHLSSQAPGTGLWICETSKYQQWQDSSEHGSLWIKGVPGAGKSVIAASMIQHLQKTEDAPILYFFFRYIISANRRPRSLVRDFLAQLLPYSVRLQATLQPLITCPLEDFSDERLWEHLLAGLSSINKAYCVVDALDEMELLPKDGFLNRLNTMATFRPAALKLLMTSRPKQYLQSTLRDASIVHISLEDGLVGKDISLFLSYRLKILLPYDENHELQSSLVSAISERSSGLFLYARLLLDQIIPSLGSTQLDVENLVRNLPLGLEEMYNTMLSQQAASLGIDTQIQVFLLQLATHSSRALRLNEVASILASAFPTSMIPDTLKVVARSACAPLLEILEDETVSIIHHSFTEFLLNGGRAINQLNATAPQFPILNPNEVHKRLAVLCMEYLRGGALRVHSDNVHSEATKPAKRYGYIDDTPKETDGYNYQEAKLQYPFLEYAVVNWAFHASKYDCEDDDFFDSLEGFLDPDSIDFKKWLQLEWMQALTSSQIEAPSPLHVAAFAGLTAYAKRLLEGQAPVDPLDAEARTPLHWACARGHAEMVSLLLQKRATPDPEDTRGVKPIHEAARKNHAVIVKLLLEAGVDPLTPKTKENVKRHLVCGEVSTKGETAVEYAWLQGHKDTILTMLPFLKPDTLEQLFCQCCRYGKFEVVRALLKAIQISPNATYSGATALYLACRAQNVGIVELLLTKGADVHQTSKWKITNRNVCGGGVHEEPVRLPIHGVVVGWKEANNLACQQILRLLLSTGADIEAKDDNGDTTLLSALGNCNSRVGELFAVKGLLQGGANVLAVDKYRDSVLHRCLRVLKDIEILEVLFEHGAKADVIGKDGNTILHTAMSSFTYSINGLSLPDMINLLLEKGARCDVKNSDGITALEYAATNIHCNLEAFAVLLRACGDVDTVQRCMWRLRAFRDRNDTPDYIRLLQDFGASLEERDSDGATVLLRSTNSRELFAAFVECGSNLKAVDFKGRGVLNYYICGRPYEHLHEALERLVEMVDMGLNPMRVDYEGNTLLHALAKIYTSRETDDLFVQKLLDYGISVNSRNNQGLTPLHVHLDDWDPSILRPAHQKSFGERFHERCEIPLLNLFKKSKEVVDINAQDRVGVTIFHLAALRSEARMFHLLEQGADPLLLTRKNRNSLHLACRARQSNVVGYLCKAYPRMINQQDEYGRTPLHDACSSGRPESVHLLLLAGARITILDKNKRTPLHACAEFGDEQRLWELLSRPDETRGHIIQDRFRPVSGGRTAYRAWYAEGMYSPETKFQEPTNIGLVVKMLLSAGSDVMAVDSHDQSPLDLALRYDCQEMIEALEFSALPLMKKWLLEPDDPRLPTLLALKKLKSSPLSDIDSEDLLCQDVYDNLSTYLRFLSFEEIMWIAQNGGNITGFDESKPVPSSGESLLYIAASTGLTQLMETFGTLARTNDDTETVRGRINEQLAVNPDYNPLVKKLAPTLHVACGRELPNMDMIHVLIDKCGVDVNAHALVHQQSGPQRWANIADSIEGGTALHVLAKSRYWWQLEALKYLLDNGAKIDALNENGETPLHIACTGTNFAATNWENGVYGYWRIEVVKILLESGADISVLDKNGLSCLHKAISSPKVMRILLENGADLMAGKFSPVFSAIQVQCLETLTILLDAGVSPNVTDLNIEHEGFQMRYTVKNVVRTALMCASFAGLHNQSDRHHSSMVKLLIERGADIYAALNEKETLIHYVFEHAQFEIVDAFMECAKAINIDLNTRDSLGRTVFIAACESTECLPGYQHKNRYPKVKAPFLRTLDLGADPLVLDNEGRNALHHLLDNPETEEDTIIQFLAHDSAKILLNQKDKHGFTPLNCALRVLRPAVIEVMITMGQDLLSPDPTGATALHRIAEQCLRAKSPCRRYGFGREHLPEYYTGVLSLWKKFIALGGSINVRDNRGAPPLFYFLSSDERDVYNAPEDECCHLEYFDTYFSQEVAPDLNFAAKNENGENALHVIAKREKKDKIFKRREGHNHVPTHDKDLYHFFVKKGLNALEEDGKGRSSLDVAAACDQKSILELFQYGK